MRVIFFRLLLSLLLLASCAAAAATPAPVAEYRSRIGQALAELEGAARRGSGESAPEHDERLSRALEAVERAVPPDETVDWERERVRINNAWLADELKNFRQLPPYDPRGEEIVKRIIERLRALYDRLAELDSLKAGAADKAQEKARLEEILRRAEYADKPQEENVLQRMWRSFVEWWNNLFPRRSGLQPGQMSWLSFIAMILVFGLAGGLLGYAAWKLLPFFQRRRAKTKPEEQGARIVLGERLAPDETAADILKEAEALARKGEIRAAIRRAYIALLCELGDRKILTLAQHKTNRDYLRAVREKRPLLDEMQKLTNSFENHWYGALQATPDDWTAFRSGYDKILNVEF